MQQTPTKIGYYKVEGELCVTSRARLLRACEEGLDGEVVIKLLNPDFFADRTFKIQFEDGLRSLALLEDLAVVPVLNLGEFEGQPYLALRYMPHGTLADRMAQRLLPLEEIVELVQEIALALDTAHQNDIIHGNLKPSNILFDEDDRPFLQDFGFMRGLGPAESTQVINPIYGSPSWLSPEQLLSEPVDCRADIYALGALIFELLTGRPPFLGASPAAQAAARLSELPPPLHDLCPDLPAELQSLLDSAMAVNPADRYSSALDLASDLEEIIFGAQAPEPDPAPPAHRKTLRLAWAVGVMLGVGLLIFGALLGLQILRPGTLPPQITAFLPAAPQVLPAVEFSAETGANTPTSEAASQAGQKTEAALPSESGILPTKESRPAATATKSPNISDNSSAPVSPTTSPAAVKVPARAAGGADMLAFIHAGDIWTVHLDGSDLERITSDKTEKKDLRWTPDGQLLLYNSEGCAYRLDPDTGKTERLVCNLSFDFSATFLNALIYNGKTHHVFPLNSNLPSQISVPAAYNKCSFEGGSLSRISPDGKRVATVVKVPQDGRQVDVIQVLELGNCGDKPILKDMFPAQRFTMRGYSGPDNRPEITDFGWDGDSLFALHGNVLNGFGDLTVYNMESGRSELINPIDKNCCYQDVQWSPDGEYLFFAYQDARFAERTEFYYVPYGSLGTGMAYEPLSLPFYFLTNPKERSYPALRPVAAQADTTAQGSSTPSQSGLTGTTSQAAYHPPPVTSSTPLNLGGGQSMAFVHRNDIWMVNFDGSGLERLTSDAKPKKDLEWTPDGKALIYRVDGCLTMYTVETRSFQKAGCFADLEISPNMWWTVLGDLVSFPNATKRWLNYLVPYDLTSLKALNSLPRNMAGCPFDGGKLTRFSNDGTRIATVVDTPYGGRRVEAIEVLDFAGCLTQPRRIDIFPAQRFSLRGYSGVNDRPEIASFGWDGESLFALNGNVQNGFGDMLIYNLKTGRSETISPIHNVCCYQGMQWSPNQEYFAFAFQDTRFTARTELFYIPYGTIGSGIQYLPIPLPPDFLTDRTAAVYPAVRPAEYVQPEVPAAVARPTDPQARSTFRSPIIGGADQIAVINASEIWIANLDGSNLEKLTSDKTRKANLKWTPEGLSLVYSSKDCWYMVGLVDKKVSRLGCFTDLSFSPNGLSMLVSKYVKPDSKTQVLWSFLVPYNLQRLQEVKSFEDLPSIGGCLVSAGRQFSWSGDGSQVAQIVNVSKQGYYGDDVQIYKRHLCAVQSTRLDAFPSTRFEMRGYSGSEDNHLLDSYGWDGQNSFAIHGDVANGYGDLWLYDLVSKRSELFNPINQQCCYQDAQWSPDGTHMLFSFQSGKYTRVYYQPFEGLGKYDYYQPFPFPEDFFADPTQEISPVLRPAAVLPAPQGNANLGAGKLQQVSVKKLHELTFKNPVLAAAFSPDGAQVAASSDSTIQIYEAQTGRLLRTLPAGGIQHAGNVTGLAYSPNGDFLASVSTDKTVILWRLDEGIAKFQLTGHNLAVNGVAYSPDGALVASASSDQTVKIWRTQNAGLVVTLQGHTGPVMHTAFSPGGDLLASSSADGTIKIWKVQGGVLLHTLQAGYGVVRTAAFSPYGETLASAGYDGNLRLWNVSSGELMHTLKGHAASVESAAFSADGEYLISASADSTIAVWRISDHLLLGGLNEHKKPAVGAVLSPQGDFFATFSYDSRLIIWEGSFLTRSSR